MAGSKKVKNKGKVGSPGRLGGAMYAQEGRQVQIGKAARLGGAKVPKR